MLYLLSYTCKCRTLLHHSHVMLILMNTVSIWTSLLSVSVAEVLLLTNWSVFELLMVGFLRGWEQPPPQEYEKPFWFSMCWKIKDRILVGMHNIGQWSCVVLLLRRMISFIQLQHRFSLDLVLFIEDKCIPPVGILANGEFSSYLAVAPHCYTERSSSSRLFLNSLFLTSLHIQ